MNKLSTQFIALFVLIVTSLSVNASFNNYSNVYVFGDSLSDTGNLSMVPGAPPGTPSRFTNGPVATEIVAGFLGFVLEPSNHLNGGFTGNNFAIAGALAIDEDGDELTPDINLPTQVNAFLQITGGVAPSNALYIVTIGGNDIRAARDIYSGFVFAETGQERSAIRQTARASIRTAVASQQAQIAKLIAAGAQDILVVNAPDVGAAPETDLIVADLLQNTQNQGQKRRANSLPTRTTSLSIQHNNILKRKLSKLEKQFSHVNINEFDLFGFLSDQVDGAEEFGYTNVDDACVFVFSQQGAPNPECVVSAPDFPQETSFLFWDELHPTATAHLHAGEAAIDTLLAQ